MINEKNEKKKNKGKKKNGCVHIKIGFTLK